MKVIKYYANYANYSRCDLSGGICLAANCPRWELHGINYPGGYCRSTLGKLIYAHTFLLD